MKITKIECDDDYYNCIWETIVYQYIKNSNDNSISEVEKEEIPKLVNNIDILQVLHCYFVKSDHSLFFVTIYPPVDFTLKQYISLQDNKINTQLFRNSIQRLNEQLQAKGLLYYGFSPDSVYFSGANLYIAELEKTWLLDEKRKMMMSNSNKQHEMIDIF